MPIWLNRKIRREQLRHEMRVSCRPFPVPMGRVDRIVHDQREGFQPGAIMKLVDPFSVQLIPPSTIWRLLVVGKVVL